MGDNKTVIISVIFAVFNQQTLSLGNAVPLDSSKQFCTENTKFTFNNLHPVLQCTLHYYVSFYYSGYRKF